MRVYKIPSCLQSLSFMRCAFLKFLLVSNPCNYGSFFDCDYHAIVIYFANDMVIFIRDVEVVGIIDGDINGVIELSQCCWYAFTAVACGIITRNGGDDALVIYFTNDMVLGVGYVEVAIII